MGKKVAGLDREMVLERLRGCGYPNEKAMDALADLEQEKTPAEQREIVRILLEAVGGSLEPHIEDPDSIPSAESFIPRKGRLQPSESVAFLKEADIVEPTAGEHPESDTTDFELTFHAYDARERRFVDIGTGVLRVTDEQAFVLHCDLTRARRFTDSRPFAIRDLRILVAWLSSPGGPESLAERFRVPADDMRDLIAAFERFEIPAGERSRYETALRVQRPRRRTLDALKETREKG